MSLIENRRAAVCSEAIHRPSLSIDEKLGAEIERLRVAMRTRPPRRNARFPRVSLGLVHGRSRPAKDLKEAKAFLAAGGRHELI
jgi:hypothetical protein